MILDTAIAIVIVAIVVLAVKTCDIVTDDLKNREEDEDEDLPTAT